MKIKLSEFGPTMWFLGEPKKLVLSLTFKNPGPVDIEFAQLNSVDQNKLLKAIRTGIIESDVSFHELSEKWVKGDKSQSSETKETGSIDLVETNSTICKTDQRLVWAQQIEEKRNILQAQKTQEEVSILERCKYLMGLTVRGLKTTLKQEKNIKVLRTLLKLEESHKARKLVLETIREKIRVHDHELSLEILQHTKSQLASPVVGIPKDNMSYTIEESDLETVTLTPEALISSAI